MSSAVILRTVSSMGNSFEFSCATIAVFTRHHGAGPKVRDPVIPLRIWFRASAIGMAGSSPAMTKLRDLFAPKPLRCKVGARAQGLQLRPHDRRRYPLAAREGAEAAVGGRYNTLAVANRRDRFFEAARDHFR